MRAVIQRVASASVRVQGPGEPEVVGAIDRGLLVLLCVMAGDTVDDEQWLVAKLLALRIFPDASGRMDRSVLALADEGGPPPGILVVSQFTLSADLTPGRSKGNRPAFVRAEKPEKARATVDAVLDRIRTAVIAAGAPQLVVAGGRFGADMRVELVNDGPVTLWIDTRADVDARQEPA